MTANGVCCPSFLEDQKEDNYDDDPDLPFGEFVKSSKLLLGKKGQEKKEVEGEDDRSGDIPAFDVSINDSVLANMNSFGEDGNIIDGSPTTTSNSGTYVGFMSAFTTASSLLSGNDFKGPETSDDTVELKNRLKPLDFRSSKPDQAKHNNLKKNRISKVDNISKDLNGKESSKNDVGSTSKKTKVSSSLNSDSSQNSFPSDTKSLGYSKVSPSSSLPKTEANSASLKKGKTTKNSKRLETVKSMKLDSFLVKDSKKVKFGDDVGQTISTTRTYSLSSEDDPSSKTICKDVLQPDDKNNYQGSLSLKRKLNDDNDEGSSNKKIKTHGVALNGFLFII